MTLASFQRMRWPSCSWCDPAHSTFDHVHLRQPLKSRVSACPALQHAYQQILGLSMCCWHVQQHCERIQ